MQNNAEGIVGTALNLWSSASQQFKKDVVALEKALKRVAWMIEVTEWYPCKGQLRHRLCFFVERDDC